MQWEHHSITLFPKDIVYFEIALRMEIQLLQQTYYIVGSRMTFPDNSYTKSIIFPLQLYDWGNSSVYIMQNQIILAKLYLKKIKNYRPIYPIYLIRIRYLNNVVTYTRVRKNLHCLVSTWTCVRACIHSIWLSKRTSILLTSFFLFIIILYQHMLFFLSASFSSRCFPFRNHITPYTSKLYRSNFSSI